MPVAQLWIVRRRRHLMRKLTLLFVSFLCIAIVVLAVDLFRAKSRLSRAATIAIGDSKSEVSRLLGDATMVTPFSVMWRSNALSAAFCETYETWAYGRIFDFSGKFPWYRLWLFIPNPDDIAIEFNASGRVIRVTIPNRRS